MHVPDEGYSRNMSCTYLMKVIPETCYTNIPDEGFSRNMSCTYLMKVIPETCHART
jgi:hypothetical protein